MTQWVAFYKQYRQILDSDIIHLRRPDGQDWDGIMHVNPQSKRKAFISVYNPLDIAIEREIEVPLYYTGLTNKAIVKEQDKNGKEYSLARKAFISVYNPLDIAIEREIEVPLYYTGLTNKAIVKEQDKNGKEYSLARNYSILLKIRIPAKGYNWYIIE